MWISRGEVHGRLGGTHRRMAWKEAPGDLINTFKSFNCLKPYAESPAAHTGAVGGGRPSDL